MRTTAVIEGLTILEKYRSTPDGFNCSAEHDVLYAHTTDCSVENPDLGRLVELGWFQETADIDGGGDFAVKDYDPEEPWACYT